MILELDNIIKQALAAIKLKPALIFNYLLNCDGQVFSQAPGRKTIRAIIDNNIFFIKQHYGVGWKEIFKNLLQLKKPVLGAVDEKKALLFLKKHNIPTLKILGFGLQGINPAKQRSFIITEELQNTENLEELTKSWQTNPPSYWFKQALIKNLAQTIANMHNRGLNHRDCYLCHFRLDLELAKQSPQVIKLFVIDLHRAQIRKKTPQRWREKDLAGLYFSSLRLKLTRRDLYRFIMHYNNQSLRETLAHDLRFWQAINFKAQKLFNKHEKRE